MTAATTPVIKSAFVRATVPFSESFICFFTIFCTISFLDDMYDDIPCRRFFLSRVGEWGLLHHLCVCCLWQAGNPYGGTIMSVLFSLLYYIPATLCTWFYSPCCTIYLPPSVPGKISPYVQFIRGDTPAGTLPAKHFNSKSLLWYNCNLKRQKINYETRR